MDAHFKGCIESPTQELGHGGETGTFFNKGLALVFALLGLGSTTPAGSRGLPRSRRPPRVDD